MGEFGFRPYAPHLSRLTATRALVVATAMIWTLLALPVPTSLRGSAALLVAALVALGVALAEATDWRVWRRPSMLDERENQVRDRSFRTAFRGIGAGVLLLVVTVVADSLLLPHKAGSSAPPLLYFTRGPRYLVAFVLLLTLLPTMTYAWLQEDPPDDHNGRRPDHLRSSARRIAGPLLAGLAVLGIWIGAIFALPPRTLAVDQSPSASITVGGARCASLDVSRELGDGLGAAVNLDADVCWNGREAWDAQEGTSLLKYFTAQDPDRTTCSLTIDASDFEEVTGQSCTEEGSPDGTIRLVATARVSSGLGSWLDRSLRATVTVSAKGKVLRLG
ncbi:MAG TPA: hypothetical protein VMW80_11760 [Candidatus Dormibacteraeota bacterium]|nr:hypothetical protein [Candidatus Dormibacteraeota bacterium]